MSASSLAKFSNILGSVKDSQDSTQLNPADLILRLLRDNRGLLPMSDLRSYTKLRDDDILGAVERLRDLKHAEVVTRSESDNQKYLRMTPAGYDFISSLS